MCNFQKTNTILQYYLGVRFIDQILQLYNDSDSLCRDIR